MITRGMGGTLSRSTPSIAWPWPWSLGRSMENAEAIVAVVQPRTGDAPRWIPSDESPADASAIEAAFGAPAPPGPVAKPGRRPLLPERRLADEWTSATVHKGRAEDRVVAVERRLILGTEEQSEEARGSSSVSRSVNTSFVERQQGTDRSRNARKSRQTSRSSKDWRVDEAMTSIT